MKKFLNKLKKNKKGLAIEMVTIVMMVTFVLSGLIVSTTLTANKFSKTALSSVTEKATLDKIGWDFIESVETGKDFSALKSEYEDQYLLDLNKEDDEWTFLVYEKVPNGAILTITLSIDKAQNTYKITKWSY